MKFMKNGEQHIINRKLDTVIELLRILVALELSKNGVVQGLIGKRLHVATATVVEMLKGMKKEQRTQNQRPH
jgi:predicted transcriptional regulator